MVLLTVYGYGLLLRCDIVELDERNTHSKATEETGMHKIEINLYDIERNTQCRSKHTKTLSLEESLLFISRRRYCYDVLSHKH